MYDSPQLGKISIGLQACGITESELTFSLVAMAAAQLQSQYKQSEYFADPE